MPTLLLQIAWPDGTVARMRAGGPMEKDFIGDVIKRATEKGIGLLVTENQVSTRIEEAMHESLQELKQRTLQGFE